MKKKSAIAADPSVEKPFDPVAFAHAWQSAVEEAAPVLMEAAARATGGLSGGASIGDTPLDPMQIGQAISEFWAHYARHPSRLIELQMQYAEDMGQLVQENIRKFMGDSAAADVVAIDPVIDRRFRDPAWHDNAAFNFMRQGYMIARGAVEKSLQEAKYLPAHDRQKLEFYTRLYLDALSPRNFAMTNPEVIRETIRSGGDNLVKGLQNLVADIKRGGGDLKVSTINPEAFTVGKNLAMTPGHIVFRNRMMELIQYTPTTKTVHTVPILMISPWINKYYILDLRPENSYVRFALDQGFTVFMISWVNPDASYADVLFDDYLKQGALEALDVIQNITGSSQTNIVGYCIGGTLSAILLAYLVQKKQENRVGAVTMLTTLLDFARAGDMKVFIDEAQIETIEDRMQKSGFLTANVLQKTFSILRANDMIWSFVINNYMMGREPFPFDILYWNEDSTNLPAAFHAAYLRQMYLHNYLIQPKKLTVAGVKIDLSTIKIPLYFLSTREDHIAPWGATYDGALLLSRTNPNIRFTLAASGHVAGIVNPPASEKYGYWAQKIKARSFRSALPDQAEDWLEKTEYFKGSWWGDWAKWMAGRAGARVKPPPMGSKKYPILGEAPGDYVQEKPDRPE